MKGIYESVAHMYHTNTKLVRVHHTHTDKHAYMHKNIYMRIPTYTHAHVHMHKNIHMYACTYIYT